MGIDTTGTRSVAVFAEVRLNRIRAPAGAAVLSRVSDGVDGRSLRGIAILRCAAQPGGPSRSTGGAVQDDARESAAAPGALRLRPAPAGMPADDLRPPVVAESGDPFATLKVLQLVARVEHGRAVRIDDLVDALNAANVDWLFERRVVGAVLVALQASWMSDYRNAGGIVLSDGPYGPTVAIEDSSRVDPWIVRRVAREASACREALEAFSRLDRLGSGA